MTNDGRLETDYGGGVAQVWTTAWDVRAVKGPRRNVVAPRTITDDRPGSVPQSPTLVST